jgi:outer membrane immunogenic protein
MKKRFIFSILVVALSIPFACADEQTSPKASQPATLPTWTGFYAGVNAGSLWSNTNASSTVDWSRLTAGGNIGSATFTSVPQTGFGWTGGPGFVGGGQVGYNWQMTNKIVVGIETDFQGVAGGGSNWNTGWMSNSLSSKGPSSIGSVRGRAGYLVAPNLQVYGTGGFSYSGN